MTSEPHTQVSHTPGPWEIRLPTHRSYEWDEGDRGIWREGLPNVIAEVFCRFRDSQRSTEQDAECAANARLIAAAPSLLEALEDALAQFAGTPWAETEGYERAKVTAKKARGES